MAVAFMISLEKDPETYEHLFDNTLEGRVTEIHNVILKHVKSGMRVLDLGCGTGRFARDAASRGAIVDAIDANEAMISYAKQQASEMSNAPNFISMDVLRLGEHSAALDETTSTLIDDKYDMIVSTFLLSELKPSERYLLIQIIQNMLKQDGIFAIAAETLPKRRLDRRVFWKNRRKSEREAKRKLPPPITDLEGIVEASGLNIKSVQMYGSEIMLVFGENGGGDPKRIFTNLVREYRGFKAQFRIWYNHMTGSWRGIPTRPGLYKVGSPDKDSPVIVTANYELTYFEVMRALAKDGIDAWVLVCDTDGINVWCAARGTHFDTDDVVHMVRLVDLHSIVSHRELILPQLSAAGMNPTEIKRRTGFRIRYGPIRIEDFSDWVRLGKLRPKPREMATVKFNLRERLEMSVAHVPFLFAVLLWKPMAAILLGLLLMNLFSYILFQNLFLGISSQSLGIVVLLGQFTFALIANAFLLGLVFPFLPSRNNSFLRRGTGFAIFTVPLTILIMILLNSYWTSIINWTAFQFILAITLTMDFAGMTPVSDPKSIRAEFPYMLLTLIFGIVFLVTFNMIAFILKW